MGHLADTAKAKILILLGLTLLAVGSQGQPGVTENFPALPGSRTPSQPTAAPSSPGDGGARPNDTLSVSRAESDRQLILSKIDNLEKSDARLASHLVLVSIVAAVAVAIPPILFAVIGFVGFRWARDQIDSSVKESSAAKYETLLHELRARVAAAQAMLLGNVSIKDGAVVDEGLLDSAIGLSKYALAQLEGAAKDPDLMDKIRNNLAYFYAVGEKSESGEEAVALVKKLKTSKVDFQYFVDTEARVFSQFPECLDQPARELLRVKKVLDDLLKRDTVSEQRKKVYEATLRSYVKPAVAKYPRGA